MPGTSRSLGLAQYHNGDGASSYGLVGQACRWQLGSPIHGSALCRSVCRPRPVLQMNSCRPLCRAHQGIRGASSLDPDRYKGANVGGSGVSDVYRVSLLTDIGLLVRLGCARDRHNKSSVIKGDLQHSVQSPRGRCGERCSWSGLITVCRQTGCRLGFAVIKRPPPPRWILAAVGRLTANGPFYKALSARRRVSRAHI